MKYVAGAIFGISTFMFFSSSILTPSGVPWFVQFFVAIAYGVTIYGIVDRIDLNGEAS